jgi:hypothetical protein
MIGCCVIRPHLTSDGDCGKHYVIASLKFATTRIVDLVAEKVNAENRTFLVIIIVCALSIVQTRDSR